uniref:Uncharacterized protein n=1 Tax=Citrifermentans bremense TaxID=60035 RepID=A0A6S6M479_9BACT
MAGSGHRHQPGDVLALFQNLPRFDAQGWVLLFEILDEGLRLGTVGAAYAPEKVEGGGGCGIGGVERSGNEQEQCQAAGKPEAGKAPYAVGEGG